MGTGKQSLGLTTDEEWLETLIKSVTTPIIDGVHMPRFPTAELQTRLVGSSDEVALREGAKFHHYAKAYAEAVDNPIKESTRMLDFGMGYGRYARLFSGDIDPAYIQGVDVDMQLVHTCRSLGVPGTFSWIRPTGTLPFEDASFDLIIAYSVFSHLPENVAVNWAQEISRVSKPGAVFVLTTEPPRFLDFIENIAEPAEFAWHAGLARFKHMLPELRAQCEAGELAFIPTSGGAHLPATEYGDTVIPESYFKSKWAHLFDLRAYVDDPNVFWQAFVVLQKPFASV